MVVKRGSRNPRRKSRRVTKNLVRRKRVKRTVGRRRGGGILKSFGSAAADAGKRAAKRSMEVAKDAGTRAAEKSMAVAKDVGRRSMEVAKDAGRRSMEAAKDAGTRAAKKSFEFAKDATIKAGNMAVEKTLEGAQMVGEKLAKGAQERLENRTVEAAPVEAPVEAPTGGRSTTSMWGYKNSVGDLTVSLGYNAENDTIAANASEQSIGLQYALAAIVSFSAL